MAGETDPVVEVYDALTQNPSVLGRLIYIANLWNQQTSRYDRGLPDRFRTPDVNQAFARWHHASFIQWLSMPLREKERDVALYWRSIGGTPDQIHTLRQQAEIAIPPLVRDEERKLFIQDLVFVMAML